jgi:hypothetical protein
MSRLADDLLRGIAEIAEYTGETYRAAHWRIVRGDYPVTRVGKIVTARKSEIDKVYAPPQDAAPAAT